MQKNRRRKFGEILMSEGLITREVLQTALQRQTRSGESLGEILLAESIINESDIVRCICIQYQLPFIRPSQYHVDANLLDSFSSEFLYRNRIVPLDRIGSTAIVALGEILDSKAVEKELQEKLESKIYYYFSPVSDVEDVLRKHFSIGPEQAMAMDDERRARNRGGQEPAASIQVTENTGSGLDSSWEAIFDEAEKNVLER